MAKPAHTTRPKRNGRKPKTEVSELGKILTRLSNQMAKSGEKPLSREEIEREVEERRLGRF